LLVAPLLAVPLIGLLVGAVLGPLPAASDGARFKEGTSSQAASFQVVPAQRPTRVVSEVEVDGREVAAAYDPAMDRIEIASATGSDPRCARHALRHEYGHALVIDILTAAASDRESARRTIQEFRGLGPHGDRMIVPEALRPVFDEYATFEPETYGDGSLSSDFGEYMAESYARYLDGSRVPPVTARFLGDVAAMEPASPACGGCHEGWGRVAGAAAVR
jgi:hypothetical protein